MVNSTSTQPGTKVDFCFRGKGHREPLLLCPLVFNLDIQKERKERLGWESNIPETYPRLQRSQIGLYRLILRFWCSRVARHPKQIRNELYLQLLVVLRCHTLAWYRAEMIATQPQDRG
jgi:hypothetical protein